MDSKKTSEFEQAHSSLVLEITRLEDIVSVLIDKLDIVVANPTLKSENSTPEKTFTSRLATVINTDGYRISKIADEIYSLSNRLEI